MSTDDVVRAAGDFQFAGLLTRTDQILVVDAAQLIDFPAFVIGGAVGIAVWFAVEIGWGVWWHVDSEAKDLAHYNQATRNAAGADAGSAVNTSDVVMHTVAVHVSPAHVVVGVDAAASASASAPGGPNMPPPEENVR